ncbi:hypothetical protein H9Q70_009971 [Fusarium xylarioides]|nr:hypothetical protein H9Q70_009971 [Fusarium xylarioides]
MLELTMVTSDNTTQQELDNSPDDKQDLGLAIYMHSIALVLRNHFHDTREKHTIEEAADMAETAILVASDRDTNLPHYYYSLALILGDQFCHSGLPDTIEHAIGAARRASELAPKGCLNRLCYLDTLSYMLYDQFNISTDHDNLRDSLKAIEEAVKECPEVHPGRSEYVDHFGRVLIDLVTFTGSVTVQELELGLGHVRQSVNSLPDDCAHRAQYLSTLAEMLHCQYTITLGESGASEAVQAAKDAIAAAPERSLERAIYLHSLGRLLADRWDYTQAKGDIDEAIQLARQATTESYDHDTDWVNRRNDLGRFLAGRSVATGSLQDLDESIDIVREILKTPPNDRKQRLGRSLDLANRLSQRLSTALVHRFERDKSMADLETSIDLSYQAMEATSTNDVNYSTILHGVGVSLGLKYKVTNGLSDLEEAIRFAKKAVDAMGEAHRYQTEALSNVGEYLLKRAAATSCKDNEQEAARFFQRAVMKTQSSVKSRMEAARRLIFIYTSQSQWRLAYEAAVLAIDLLPQLVMRSLGNTDKQELLTIAAGLSSDAAGLALQLGESPMVALNKLERGRGMIASSLDDLHMDLDNMKAKYPDLAMRFISLRNQLGRDQISERDASLAWNQDSDKRHEAGQEFDKLVTEIRHQPGFGDFLLPPTEPEVKLATKYGPIIAVNVCALRCDAIIIEQHQMRAIPLPDFDHRTMIDFVVNEALDLTKAPGAEWPHLWWIMTGLLTKFPIHAAGVHRKGTSDSILDRVISSYQTSVQSIIRGRKRRTAARPLQQALLVSMEKTPGSFNLPNAPKEVAAVREVCESMSITTVESKPHKQDIIAQLFQSDIFHYAGHAYTDGHNPVESYLCLDADKANCLTISNLLDNNLQRQSPFLAYLSACGTGEMQNNNLTDESIHLISGFQLLGFRHVIGTLWAVRDSLCVEIARLVYEELRDRGTTDRTVAQGLHNATRKLRDSWLDSRDSFQRSISV